MLQRDHRRNVRPIHKPIGSRCDRLGLRPTRVGAVRKPQGRSVAGAFDPAKNDTAAERGELRLTTVDRGGDVTGVTVTDQFPPTDPAWECPRTDQVIAAQIVRTITVTRFIPVRSHTRES